MAMTQEELISLAKEAGAGLALTMSSPRRISEAMFRAESLTRFANLVIADFLRRTDQYVTNGAGVDAAIKAAVAPWKDAVIDQLVVAHILGADHESDPRKAVADLLDYHSEIAIDPRVSEAAAKLVEAEREACGSVRLPVTTFDYRQKILIGELDAKYDEGFVDGIQTMRTAIRARGGE